MKKIITTSYSMFFISFFSYTQSIWQVVADTNGGNNVYLDGGSVRILHNYNNNYLYIGGEFDTLHNATFSSLTSPLIRLHILANSTFFTAVDCMPFSSASIQNPSVWAYTSVYDSTMQNYYTGCGGRFSYENCAFPSDPNNLNNLYFWLDAYIPEAYMAADYMDCMDTVFAIAMVTDNDAICTTADVKTYVAAKSTFSHCTPWSGDSTSYIGFYDACQNGNYVAAINYMQGGTDGPVYAIQALDTANVYAGGKFDSAGVIKTNNIAKWNGAGWDSLSSGINGTVKCLFADNGKLYAGGSFTTAGGASANNIAVWNGTTWSAIGTGTNGMVYALTTHGGDLYAGGAFTQAGGNTVNYVAKWNGIQWSALSGGRNNEVYALASFKGDLYAGGNFTGGTSDTAHYIARFMDTTLTGLSEITNSPPEIYIYPNPSGGIFTIQSLEKISRIEILNLLGEKIYFSQANSNKREIDLSKCPSGVYFTHIFSEEKIHAGKIIIRKEEK